VPAIDILGLESDDDLNSGFAAPGPAPHEQVLIRAGQAGVADDPEARPPRPTRLTAEERQNRAGRRKLRRRAEDTP
jgi:hypothetical protein